MPPEDDSPAYHQLSVRAMPSQATGAVVIPMLSQVMDFYPSMSPSERAAVADWFHATYGQKGVANGL